MKFLLLRQLSHGGKVLRAPVVEVLAGHLLYYQKLHEEEIRESFTTQTCIKLACRGTDMP